jgi:hypothetical protein
MSGLHKNNGKKSSKPISALGDSSFKFEVAQNSAAILPQSHENNDDNESGRFDIKQFLLEQKVSHTSFHESALFRHSSREFEVAGASSSSLPGSFTRALKKPSKQQLPRMERTMKPSSMSMSMSALPSEKNKTPNHHHAVHSPDEESAAVADHDGGSGFRMYSIESMTEASLHAIQSHNKTWQTLRSRDLRSGECPCKRRDVLDLEACFDAAMSYARGKDNWAGDRKMALIDRDYMSVR